MRAKEIFIVPSLIFFLLFPPITQAAAPREKQGDTAVDHGKRIILTLLSPYIQEELNRCYKSTTHPSVQFSPFLSDTVLVKIVYYSSHMKIVLRVFPYVGPHLTVGEDELSFEIDNFGRVSPLGCRHIKDFPWNAKPAYQKAH